MIASRIKSLYVAPRIQPKGLLVGTDRKIKNYWLNYYHWEETPPSIVFWLPNSHVWTKREEFHPKLKKLIPLFPSLKEKAIIPKLEDSLYKAFISFYKFGHLILDYPIKNRIYKKKERPDYLFSMPVDHVPISQPNRVFTFFSPCIVAETLEQWLNKPHPPKERLICCGQLLKQLEEMLKKSRWHGNIRASTILVFYHQGELKCILNQNDEKIKVLCLSIDPNPIGNIDLVFIESVKDRKHLQSRVAGLDIFAMGVLFYSMLTFGKQPYPLFIFRGMTWLDSVQPFGGRQLLDSLGINFQLHQEQIAKIYLLIKQMTTPIAAERVLNDFEAFKFS